MENDIKDDAPRGIRSWAEDDRPREKMLLKSRSALSDAELVAILLGSGSRDETAVDLAKRVLKTVDNDLGRLGRLDLKQLMKFKGIGEAKAISIAAALELGRRRKETERPVKIRILGSAQAAEHIMPFMADLKHEEFWVILLDRANHVIVTHQVSSGGVSGTVVDPKMVFKLALEHLASGMILCHNHPSGRLEPSEQDKALTKKMVAAGKLLDVAVHDHIIVSDREYYSFSDNGTL